MAIFERIVTTYNDKGSKQALKDLNKLEESFVNAGKTIAKAFGAAALATAALAIKVGKDAVQGAIEDEKAQSALAIALRNTANATDDQIASTSRYLDQLELQVGINNNELIPSYQKLVQATGDLAQAQNLQNLALDISAGTGKSLGAVTDGLVRAIGGNIGALKRLGIPLDDSIIKSKDLNAALQTLSTTFAGQAEKRAGTFGFQLERLRLQFDQTLDALGYALIPVLQDLAEMIRTEVLPAFDAFIAQHKDEIAQALKDFVKFSINAATALGKMFKVMSENIGVVKALGSLLIGVFVGAKVAAAIGLITSALKLLNPAMRVTAAQTTAAGTGMALLTGGVSARAAVAGLIAFAGTAILVNKQLSNMAKGFGDTTKAITQQSQVVKGHLADLQRIEASVNKINKTTGFDSTVKDTQEAINLEASRLNLLREGRIEEAAKVKARQEEREALSKAIEEAKRYQDILQALADAQITNEEIITLAAKWNVTTEAVKNYIATFFALGDGKIDKTEIELLAAAWGMTKEQVEKYLDFVKAVKDGKLSSEEIQALQDKWGMTVREIEQYADFVIALQDYKISNEEVAALGKAWGLTDAEVLKYLETIGVPFDYKGKHIDPVNGIEKAWVDTKGAVDAYITSLGDADTALATLATNAASNAAVVQSALDSATLSAEALAVAAGGALDIAAQAQAAADAAIATANSAQVAAEVARASAEAAAAAIAAAEAAAAAAASARGAIPPIIPPDASPDAGTGGVVGSGGFIPGSGGDPIVNITVNGSVISESDLIETVREGVLGGYLSGRVITTNPTAL